MFKEKKDRKQEKPNENNSTDTLPMTSVGVIPLTLKKFKEKRKGMMKAEG